MPKPPDRADTFGELQRQEIRTWLRGLPEAERLKTALESKDQTIRDAIAFAPAAAMVGLTEEVKNRVRTSMIDQAFGARLRDIEAADADLENADVALTLAGTDLRSASGLTAGDFAAAG